MHFAFFGWAGPITDVQITMPDNVIVCAAFQETKLVPTIILEDGETRCHRARDNLLM